MLTERIHQGILRKFEGLKGQILVGKLPVKGINKDHRVPADQFVEEDHILHDLIRGFYKPAGMPFLISYQATESDENYGQQIIWRDKSIFEFKTIEMRPPSSPKDNRKKSDIAAARYNLENNIPIGILYKIEKGVNVILGLGIIVEENSNGIFTVVPHSLEKSIFTSVTNMLNNIEEDDNDNKDFVTEVVKEIKQRKGQEKFRKILLKKYDYCALCGVSAIHTRASHIKPWAVSNDRERLDLHNGLLLCPNHDYLFDNGFISFTDDGKLLISVKLSKIQMQFFNIHTQMRLKLTEQMKAYLKHHRENIFINR
ncbi:predicted restriction endonuclease [Solibacillus silvestris StLB046]|uniref:Predicted restriction endonuclease n=1 Tax=Solibacillus silvestris (strain StLB046) TaxID=1002809 RepID=F2F0C0_SOLSS|nr:HNH endonuclease [Solibacillus silvestris]BAK15230.1 predicted restriction endonuclease [Solibacillus silvestris StLB046]